jgi:hypothetical protein
MLRSEVFDWWLSLKPPAQAGYSLADLSTLKMEAIRSSETSVHTRSTRRHIPEDCILRLEYVAKILFGRISPVCILLFPFLSELNAFQTTLLSVLCAGLRSAPFPISFIVSPFSYNMLRNMLSYNSCPSERQDFTES